MTHAGRPEQGLGVGTWLPVCPKRLSVLKSGLLDGRQQRFQDDFLHTSKSWSIASASLQGLVKKLVGSPSAESIYFVCEEFPVWSCVRHLYLLSCGVLGHNYLPLLVSPLCR